MLLPYCSDRCSIDCWCQCWGNLNTIQDGNNDFDNDNFIKISSTWNLLDRADFMLNWSTYQSYHTTQHPCVVKDAEWYEDDMMMMMKMMLKMVMVIMLMMKCGSTDAQIGNTLNLYHFHCRTILPHIYIIIYTHIDNVIKPIYSTCLTPSFHVSC